MNNNASIYAQILQVSYLDWSVHEVDKEQKQTEQQVEQKERSIMKQQLNGVGVNNLMLALEYA